eukprot:1155438-Pelagomonas_calceolata.AAC.3
MCPSSSLAGIHHIPVGTKGKGTNHQVSVCQGQIKRNVLKCGKPAERCGPEYTLTLGPSVQGWVKYRYTEQAYIHQRNGRRPQQAKSVQAQPDTPTRSDALGQACQKACKQEKKRLGTASPAACNKEDSLNRWPHPGHDLASVQQQACMKDAAAENASMQAALPRLLLLSGTEGSKEEQGGSKTSCTVQEARKWCDLCSLRREASVGEAHVSCPPWLQHPPHFLEDLGTGAASRAEYTGGGVGLRHFCALPIYSKQNKPTREVKRSRRGFDC